MKEMLEIYKRARSDIASKFGLDGLWYNLIDCTNMPWYGDIREFSWSESDEGKDDYAACEVYGTSMWVSSCGEYTLYVGDNGCGDHDMYLFANSMKKDEDYFDGGRFWE